MRISLLSRLNSPQGFTLIELGIVLSIVGIIISGIWIYTAQINNNNKKLRLRQDMIQILTNTRATFANADAPSTATTGVPQAFATAGIIPSDMVVVTTGGGSLLSPFNTKISVINGPQPATGHPQVVMQLFNLPADACTDLFMSFANPGAIKQFGLQNLALNGPEAPFASFTPASIAAGCGAKPAASSVAAFSFFPN